MLLDLFRRYEVLAPDEGAGSDAVPTVPAAAPASAPADAEAGIEAAQPAEAPSPESQEPPPHEDPESSITKRLDRAKRKAVADLLTDLGLDNVDVLKEVVKSEKTRREDEMTEVQKVQVSLDKAVRERDEVQRKYETLLDGVRSERLANAVVLAAKEAKHPEDVVAWAKTYAKADLETLVDDDGAVDPARARALVTKCRKERPEWFTPETPGVPSNAGASTPATVDQVKQISQAAVVQARRFIS